VKEVFAGVEADLIEVFTAITVAFASVAVYLISFESFQFYFRIEVGSRSAPKFVHEAKLRKSNVTTSRNDAA
jgi:hypothetical protein